MKLWKLKVCFCWFRGNPVSGLEVKLFVPIEDYPSGWSSVELFGIRFIKFEFGIWLNNPRA